MSTTQTIEVVKILLKHMNDDPEQNKTLAAGCIVLLDDIMTGKVETDPKPTTTPSMGDEAPTEKPKSAQKKRKPFDTGRMKALLNGGWSVAKIADDMGCSEATIYAHMKKEGITK